MSKEIVISIFIAAIIIVLAFFVVINVNSEDKELSIWEFKSVDTMKYSRDLSREKLNDTSFDVIINEQVEAIAKTGATHVSIATPYDEEFYPILERWVKAARKNNLNVWFRGNWSGWEGWFDYKKITREEHIEKTQNFITTHPDLFADGDVFTACPECENGGPGDPRLKGDVEEHRQFMIDEYGVTKSAFKQINKNVRSNFNSMNGDVAKLVMNKETTKAMDGIVTIDHYVATPEKLTSDIKALSVSSGGKIVLGEFGAPIPDIHGQMTEDQQAEWIDKALYRVAVNTPQVIGVNYWTNTGSSTELWKKDGTAKKAVETLTSYYNAPVIQVNVKNEANMDIKNAKLILEGDEYISDENGIFYIPYLKHFNLMKISANGYFPQNQQVSDDARITVLLKKENENILFKLLKSIR